MIIHENTFTMKGDMNENKGMDMVCSIGVATFFDRINIGPCLSLLGI
jgi:hypothetical protein